MHGKGRLLMKHIPQTPPPAGTQGPTWVIRPHAGPNPWRHVRCSRRWRWQRRWRWRLQIIDHSVPTDVAGLCGAVRHCKYRLPAMISGGVPYIAVGPHPIKRIEHRMPGSETVLLLRIVLLPLQKGLSPVKILQTAHFMASVHTEHFCVANPGRTEH